MVIKNDPMKVLEMLGNKKASDDYNDDDDFLDRLEKKASPGARFRVVDTTLVDPSDPTAKLRVCLKLGLQPNPTPVQTSFKALSAKPHEDLKVGPKLNEEQEKLMSGLGDEVEEEELSNNAPAPAPTPNDAAHDERARKFFTLFAPVMGQDGGQTSVPDTLTFEKLKVKDAQTAALPQVVDNEEEKELKMEDAERRAYWKQASFLATPPLFLLPQG
jgi:hypothetical protein